MLIDVFIKDLKSIMNLQIDRIPKSVMRFSEQDTLKNK